MDQYSIGLDFGTNSCRALVVRLEDGGEVGTGVFEYAHGEKGVVLSDDPNLARQHPSDYVDGTREAIKRALADAQQGDPAFRPDRVSAIGIDATASTPIPVDRAGRPLGLKREFADEPDAMAWLWKDHTAVEESQAITELVGNEQPEVLARIGGSYSSEWFWSKILRCCRVNPRVSEAAATWVELQDWAPALLAGISPLDVKRGVCAAGHKGLYSAAWGGYPPPRLLAKLEEGLARIRESLPGMAYTIAEPVGTLADDWASDLGLPASVVVAAGGIDAHMGAVGSGVAPGVLVKIMGTSTCDIGVWPLGEELPDIPGISGVVPESVLPGMVGLEAGQAAVGDLFNWFATFSGKSHQELALDADRLLPGESGLLALDWNNGNRSILADPLLNGLLVGQTLRTTPADVYRALIEATAFGARVILERLREGGVPVEEVIVCGGVAEKSPMALQIYADILGKRLRISRSAQTCALGAAMAGAVASKAIANFDIARERLTGTQSDVIAPRLAYRQTYEELFGLYKILHDAFGTEGSGTDIVMKRLLQIRGRVKSR